MSEKKTTSSHGAKARFQDAIDNARADAVDSRATHRIDLIFAKSPEKKVLAAGIITYQIFKTAEEMPPELRAEFANAAAEDFMAIVKDPIKIRDPEKTKHSLIVRAFLEEVDNYGGKADVRLLCPGLRITRYWPAKEFASVRSDTGELHKLVREIYSLIDKGYEWDARENAIVRRRGREFAESPIIVSGS